MEIFIQLMMTSLSLVYNFFSSESCRVEKKYCDIDFTLVGQNCPRSNRGWVGWLSRQQNLVKCNSSVSMHRSRFEVACINIRSTKSRKIDNSKIMKFGWSYVMR